MPSASICHLISQPCQVSDLLRGWMQFPLYFSIHTLIAARRVYAARQGVLLHFSFVRPALLQKPCSEILPAGQFGAGIFYSSFSLASKKRAKACSAQLIFSVLIYKISIFPTFYYHSQALLLQKMLLNQVINSTKRRTNLCSISLSSCFTNFLLSRPGALKYFPLILLQIFCPTFMNNKGLIRLTKYMQCCRVRYGSNTQQIAAASQSD